MELTAGGAGWLGRWGSAWGTSKQPPGRALHDHGSQGVGSTGNRQLASVVPFLLALLAPRTPFAWMSFCSTYHFCTQVRPWLHHFQHRIRLRPPLLRTCVDKDSPSHVTSCERCQGVAIGHCCCQSLSFTMTVAASFGPPTRGRHPSTPATPWRCAAGAPTQAQAQG